MSFAQKDRNLRSRKGNYFPESNGPDCPEKRSTFAQEMSSLLRRAYGGRHSAVKVVAAAVGANERAVKNWFDGQNAPSGENLLRLVVHSDVMLIGFLTLAGKDHLAIAAELDRVAAALETALDAVKRVRGA